MNKIQHTADVLVQKLNQNGFTVHYHPSSCSDSIYLTVDYGEGNTIRVSDHNSKKMSKCKYNINTRQRKFKRTAKGKFYYPIEDTNLLIKHIIKEREKRIKYYGKLIYNEKCQQHSKHYKINGFTIGG